MKSKLTIKDIAKLANVSITTTSRIINHKPDGYSEETREKVLSVIKKYGYMPNLIARSLVTNQTRLIGVLIPDIRNPFYAEISRGIEVAAYEKDINVMLFNSNLQSDKFKKQIMMCIERNVDGIIMVSQYLPVTESVNQLKKHEIPLVMIDTLEDKSKYNVVETDIYHGAFLATEYLIKLGHKNIACIESDPYQTHGLYNSISRTEGYISALKTYGIPIKKHLIIASDSSNESGRKSMEQLLKYYKEFTAVFIQNDIMAFSAYQAIKEANLKIPDDISVVGFDDISFCKISDPPLTTVKQPTYEMGYEAMNMLFKLINKKNKRRQHKIFQPELVIRKSVRSI